MKSLRRTLAALLVALLALTNGAALAPRALLAAPVTQQAEGLVGYFESDVLPSDETDGLVVGLFLYDDGTAEITSDYLNDEDPIVEVGEWVDNGDGTLTLTVIGTREAAYQAPIDLAFNVLEDGTLEIPGAPDGIFGEAGLTLYVAEPAGAEAAADATPAPTEEATPEATAAPAEEATPEATATPAEEAAPEATPAPTEEAAPEAADGANPAVGELLATVPDDAYVYQSAVLPAASSPGQQLTMILYADNTLQLVSDYLNGEAPVIEVGTWAENDAGVEITLTGQADGTEYDEPLTLQFTLNDDGGLDLVDEGGVLFGETGLTMNPLVDFAADETGAAATMNEAPAGVYVSALLPEEDGANTFLTAMLYDDGSLVVTTATTDGSLPETEVGEWTTGEDGSYVMNITGTADEAYAEPSVLPFTLNEDGSLDVSGIPLYPLGDIALASAPALLGEFQSEVMPAASSPGLQVTLSLYDDLSAQMVSDYQNDDEVVVELGTWDVNDAGQLLVTLTGKADETYDTPVEYVFDTDENGVLTLAEGGEAFGEAGLTLTPLEGDLAAVEEGATAEEGTAEGDTAAEPDMVIYDAELPVEGSDTPAILLLGFTQDGIAVLDIDYQDGAESETYSGEWVDNGDGTYTVTFTEGPDGALGDPMVMTVTEDETGALTVTEASGAAADLVDIVFVQADLSQ